MLDMEIISDRLVAFRNDNCIKCGFCDQYIDCSLKTNGCIGCGACVAACPQGARELRVIPANQPVAGSKDRMLIGFFVNGEPQQLRGPISVSTALEQLELGSKADASGPEHHKADCGTGGCWECAILINGVLTRSCITPLRSGMQIETNPQTVNQVMPKRVVTVMRPEPHRHPSIFTHGCNYRCDLCHNWDLTFSSTARSLTPIETVAQLMVRPEKDKWIGISGGEPTLNRPWLVQTVKEIRHAAPESRIQLDTNASTLTPEYLDELIEAGITDISPDLKAFRLDTFMEISGFQVKKSAKLFMQTAWNAIRYLHAKYSNRVFMAVSIPFHPGIHSKRELQEMGVALAELDPEIPVTLTELLPSFRSRNWNSLNFEYMKHAAAILETEGLNRIIIQGGEGIPHAVDPADLKLSSEEF